MIDKRSGQKMMLAEEQISRLWYGGGTEAVPTVYSPDGHDALDWHRSEEVHCVSWEFPL